MYLKRSRRKNAKNCHFTKPQIATNNRVEIMVVGRAKYEDV